MVDECLQPVEQVERQAAGGRHDRLGIFEVPAAHEDRETPEQCSRVRVQQVMAPVDGAPQCPLAVGAIGRGRLQQVKAMPQARQQGLRWQQLDARRRQLDGQRQAVEADADLDDGGSVRGRQREVRPDRPRAQHEQRHRLGCQQRIEVKLAAGSRERQRRHRHLLLSRDVQGRPAGDDDLEVAGPAQQPGHRVRGREHLLEVVEHEQHVTVGDAVHEGLHRASADHLLEAQHLPDGRRHQLRVADGGQRHEHGTIAEVGLRATRDLHRQACLAGAAGTGQRQQPGGGQQPPGAFDLPLAADEGGDLGGQLLEARRYRADGREVRSAGRR